MSTLLFFKLASGFLFVVALFCFICMHILFRQRNRLFYLVMKLDRTMRVLQQFGPIEKQVLQDLWYEAKRKNNTVDMAAIEYAEFKDEVSRAARDATEIINKIY